MARRCGRCGKPVEQGKHRCHERPDDAPPKGEIDLMKALTKSLKEREQRTPEVEPVALKWIGLDDASVLRNIVEHHPQMKQEAQGFLLSLARDIEREYKVEEK